MRKPIFLVLALLVLCSHNLYIKLETYFLAPNQTATLSLYNGTFENSENIIARDRILDASIVANGERTAIRPERWTDQDSTITQLTFNTGKAATYVAGVSTKARNIELTADKFNSYLEHDGVLDMLKKRSQDGTLGQDAVESYQKHVKAIYQVGDNKTDDWKTELGYPIELIPQENPYEKYNGDKLEVQLLLDGAPLVNQLVFAAHISSNHHHHGDHSHEHDGETHTHDADTTHNHQSDSGHGHSHANDQQLRTNAQGKVTVDLPEEGIYYLRTIHMTEVTDSDELTHLSKWATLTFEIGHRHDETTHTHEEEAGIPTWAFILGSLLLITVLFFIFRKQGNDA